MSLQMWTTPTPVGTWIVVAEENVVVASGFGAPSQVCAQLPDGSPEPVPATDLGPISQAVEDYLAGDVSALDNVAVRQPGGEFRQKTWQAMREITPGKTWSYSELATKGGNPRAVRAAGSACATNAVAPFVPCHRVVRSDGTMGGYAFGLPVKTWLLSHEELSTEGRRPNNGGS